MRKFLALLLLSATAWAVPVTPPSKSIPTIDVLVNGNFEARTAGWTSTGASMGIDSSTPIEGKASLTCTASGSSQHCDSAQYAIPAGLKGGNCSVSVLYQTTETTNRWQLEAVDGSSNVLGKSGLLHPTTGPAAQASASFVCPSSGTIGYRMVSSGSAALIRQDLATLGSNSLIQISQSSMYGAVSWPLTASCNWSSVSADTFAPFSPVSACTLPVGANIEGNASAPATKIPAIKFASLPPGDYEIHATGLFQNTAGGAPCAFAISDGTTVKPAGSIYIGAPIYSNNVVARFSYASTQSNVTFDIEATGNTASSTCDIEDSQGSDNLNIWVIRHPSVSDLAVNIGNSALNWSGYTTETTPWTTGSATYADPTGSAGVVLTQITNTNFGTVVTEGTGLPGITFTPQVTGTYHVCATANIAASGTDNASVRLVDGSLTVINPGFAVNVGSAATNPITLCGDYAVASSGSPVTVKLQLAIGSGSAVITDASSPSGSAAIHWQISNANQPASAPAIVGGVVSPSAGVMETVSVSFAGDVGETVVCTSDPCTISKQSGGVSAVNRSSAGVYAIHFSAGVFSAPPTCTGISSGIAGVRLVSGDGVVNTSTVVELTSVVVSTLASTDDGVHVICLGPK